MLMLDTMLIALQQLRKLPVLLALTSQILARYHAQIPLQDTMSIVLQQLRKLPVLLALTSQTPARVRASMLMLDTMSTVPLRPLRILVP